MEKDTVLSPIFPDHQPDQGTNIATADTIDQVSVAIAARVEQLNVPAVTAQQQVAIAGNGGVDQRERSQAYCDLLTRRPSLGKNNNITPERFDAILSKDRRFTTLTAYVQQSRTEVTAGQSIVNSRLSSNADTVIQFSNHRVATTGDPQLRGFMLPINVDLAGLAAQETAKQQREVRVQQPSIQGVNARERQNQLLPKVNRLQAAAKKGVDLVAQKSSATKAKK